MEQNINNFRKQLIYRCSYSGTKETDLIYKKTILRKINQLNLSELKDLSSIFKVIPENKIFLILTGKLSPDEKYKKIFNKLIND